MTITILAIVFLALVAMVALAGFTLVGRQGKGPAATGRERCSICREQFDKTELVERQVGDYRLLFFCPTCIQSLQRDLTGKN